MKTFTDSQRTRLGLYLILTLVFMSCLWIGWHDFDPWVSQELVRENIRWTIRWIIQLMIQYFIPFKILIFFVKDIVVRKRTDPVENAAD